ncbi:hypothetical protein LQG66_14105 [Bradyrhizobium ontarionense]|uniref:Uncharacterized protein n=1 Tax=Bradyrhizobium ontarionense TaxID=2898149 RepID=A0ABY3RKS9_9BRAD|nr:hypothetical protein [Bradyrhizobium sp. A19]UFZ07368.1 hypothetical protein LQG66_14105 [Bradyrhizobium sp. A19]
MAAFPHDPARLCAKFPTRQTGKISTLLINNPPGNFCLAPPEKPAGAPRLAQRRPRSGSEKPITIAVLRKNADRKRAGLHRHRT